MKNNKDKTPVDESVLEETPPDINEPQTPPEEIKEPETPVETPEAPVETPPQEVETPPAPVETQEDKDKRYKAQQTEAQIQAAKNRSLSRSFKCRLAPHGNHTE